MLKVNEHYNVTVTGASAEGAGVARIDGEVVFIPRAIVGETCRIRIVNIGKTCAHGVLEQVLEASSHRVTPRCPHFGQCGGCDFWHMDYEMELMLKRQRVLDALQRIGGVAIDDLPITGAPSCEGYRNKIQYPVQEQNGHAVAGFYRARTHEVIGVSSCKIQPECGDAIRKAVLSWMERYCIRAYGETTHRGYIRHIYIRCGFASGKILVCIVANCQKLPKAKQLVQTLLQAEPNISGIVFCENTKKGNSVLGSRYETLYGEGQLEDTLCGYSFRLSPAAFYQVNHDQAEVLYQKAVDLAQLDGTQNVLELYCGSGTITMCLAKQAKTAIGVEIVPEAIEDAKKNAERNGVQNVQFYCMDAGQAAQHFANEQARPDVIVVDPPRKGVSEEVIDAMVSMSPKRIVYVSCDPATLARDVARLEKGGYHLQKAEAVDLFPRCAHIETVALFIRAAS